LYLIPRVTRILITDVLNLYESNRQLWGQSFGMHLPEVCMPFFCPPGQYQPELDQLNAAQSGAFIQVRN